MNPFRLRQRVPPISPRFLYRKQPRPAQHAEKIRAADGVELLIRPIQADDSEALVRAFRRMTPEQVRSRVFHALTELPDSVARSMSHADPETTIAAVITDLDGSEIRGEGRVHLDVVTENGEFALAIDPQFTGKGLGRMLLAWLVETCRKAGMREIWGDTQADNNAMLALARSLGFSLQREADDAGLVRMWLALKPAEESRTGAA
jgi:GNAT superfamily N-acetyltransferase